MASESPERIVAELRAALRADTAGLERPSRYAVAFSGGLDSTVLLAAAVRAGLDVRALHVDHALHTDSGDWARHCRVTAAAFDVRYASLRVIVEAGSGASLEAAARDARYAALAELLEPDEVLLTAHHADDQLETVLLRLLRGTGVRGLRGVLRDAPFGRGRLLRPLLGVTRAEIRAAAEQWRLEWLEDPSNTNVDFDRNYLRGRVLPLVHERWPSAARGAQRLADAMTDAERILGAAAVRDLGGASPGRVPLTALRSVDGTHRRNALRHAVRAAGLPMPSSKQLEQLCAAVDVTRPDAQTCVQWPGGEGRVYRGTLYLLRPLPQRGPGAAPRGSVSASEPWSGPEGRVSLEPLAPDAGRSPSREGFEIRFRQGGERFRPVGDRHTRALKAWFQQQGIVPWMRDRIPLLYRDGQLAAVADLAVADAATADIAVADGGPPAAPEHGDELARAATESGHELAHSGHGRTPRWRIVWSDHPPIR